MDLFNKQVRASEKERGRERTASAIYTAAAVSSEPSVLFLGPPARERARVRGGRGGGDDDSGVDKDRKIGKGRTKKGELPLQQPNCI